MKKLVLVFFCAFSIVNINAQTVEEVINKFIDAHGGKEKLATINSLQVESVMNLEQMGLTVNMTTIKEKNKLFRLQSKSSMTPDESFTVVTDTAGYSFTPAMTSPMGSMDASLTKFTDEEFTASAFQKESEGYFAQLVNYEAKGTKASLIGKDKVNGTECNKVKLVLKTGQEMTFYISEANGQVRRLQVAAPIAFEIMGMASMMKNFGGAARFGDRKIDIDFEKYKIFEGIPFPTRQSIQFGPMTLVIENTTFKVNQAIDAKWYMVK